MSTEDGLMRRRSEDANRELNVKLEHLEQENAALRSQVLTLQGSVQLMNAEMGHLKEIFDARTRIIEKGQDLIGSQVGQIARDLQVMTSEPEKSPMGRSLLDRIGAVGVRVQENSAQLIAQDQKQEELLKWQNQVDGAILLLKFFGVAGMLSLAITIFKLIKGTL